MPQTPADSSVRFARVECAARPRKASTLRFLHALPSRMRRLPPPLFRRIPLFVFCPLLDIFRSVYSLGGQTYQCVPLSASGCVSKAGGPKSAANGVASRKHLDTPSYCKAAFTAAAKLSLHVKNRFCGGRQSQHLNGLKPFSP